MQLVIWAWTAYSLKQSRNAKVLQSFLVQKLGQKNQLSFKMYPVPQKNVRLMIAS